MNCYFCGLNLIPDQHNPTVMRCPDTKCQGYGFAIKEPIPTPQTPTPETDALVKELDNKVYHHEIEADEAARQLSDFARKLERERDEVKKENMAIALKQDQQYAELTQLQKVCDELASMLEIRQWNMETEGAKIALTNYSTLPHVKAKGKE